MIGPQTGHEGRDWVAACQLLSSRFPYDPAARLLLVRAVNCWAKQNGVSDRSGEMLLEKFGEMSREQLRDWIRAMPDRLLEDLSGASYGKSFQQRE